MTYRNHIDPKMVLLDKISGERVGGQGGRVRGAEGVSGQLGSPLEVMQSSPAESFDLKLILSKLTGLREVSNSGVSRRWMARCPGHDDSRASFAIALTTTGRLVVKCHGGCDYRILKSMLGIAEQKFSVPNSEIKRAPKYEVFAAAYYGPLSLKLKWESIQEWQYLNADRSQAFLVYRFNLLGGRKEVRPVTPCDGGYRWGLPPAPRPLYRLPELLDSDGPVVVCEGEKAADAVVASGWQATTSCGGASGCSKSDWSSMAGRQVLIWPDNDEPGCKYADDVARTCRRYGAEVSVLAPFGGPGDDAADCDDVDGLITRHFAKTFAF